MRCQVFSQTLVSEKEADEKSTAEILTLAVPAIGSRLLFLPAIRKMMSFEKRARRVRGLAKQAIANVLYRPNPDGTPNSSQLYAEKAFGSVCPIVRPKEIKDGLKNRDSLYARLRGWFST
jgi:hypothetical protein